MANATPFLDCVVAVDVDRRNGATSRIVRQPEARAQAPWFILPAGLVQYDNSSRCCQFPVAAERDK